MRRTFATAAADIKEFSRKASERDIVRRLRLLLMVAFMVVVGTICCVQFGFCYYKVWPLLRNLELGSWISRFLYGHQFEVTKIEPRIDYFDHLETWNLGSIFFCMDTA
jgi:hypothetical protein